MASLKELIKFYGQTDRDDLGNRQLQIIRDGLKKVELKEITSAEDGRKFIELLRKFRDAIAENAKLNGENYPQLLSSLLSVGEDGLYSNSLRFIFELIQNVDDCDFVNPEDCALDMQFDFNAGTIVLTYNEVGFTPFNVFAITGIAEAAKNISESKIEIGEKGIGFKSVFGVANKVLIRSGWFSFELHKNNFTIPVPKYENDNPFPGTQMTLFVGARAKEIYNQIKKQYCRKDAIFSRNPLLFLNKLTSLKMYYDTWRSMEFHVSRTPISSSGNITTETDVHISVKLYDYENGFEINEQKAVVCSRYSYPVTYSYKACQSRYGDDTKVGSNGGKKMLLQVVVPNAEFIDDVGNGALYSFLPTQLHLSVPIVCHVPFKLDASREFVDPQGMNLWFNESSNYLAEILDYAYSDWCRTARENIVYYLPGMSESLFSRNNGKEQCLSRQNAFLGSHYLNLPLFITAAGEYKLGNDIFCFATEENVTDPEYVRRMMGYQKSLFLTPVPLKTKFGITTEANVNTQLFQKALSSASVTEAALSYLDAADFDYSEKSLPASESFELTLGHIEDIMVHDKPAALLQHIACSCIKQKKRPKFSVINGTACSLPEALYEGFNTSEVPKQVESYLIFCGGNIILADIEDNQYLPCYNALILSKNNTLSSFATFCSEIDQRATFAIRIRLREASERLNQRVEDNSGTAFDYIRDLRNIRLLVKDSLGREGYKSYLDLIMKSGTDRGRFIQELLQNADDCDYAEGSKPTFLLSQKASTIITEYNEKGFTRANIRSITAIGESTKNRILEGEYRAIGEKGVGFKTIFSIASEVKIFSGEYSFSLKDQEPTIPQHIKGPEHPVYGTRMEIALKDRTSFPTYSDKDILELCLCLRQLQRIQIGSHSVSIDDNGDRRVIKIDGRQHAFRRFTHVFTITDKEALSERENGSRAISPEQTITCYVPEKTGLPEYCLYAGLPTKHKLKIPVAVDAPFELTTSREEIEIDCRSWNNIVRRELYAALFEVMDKLKESERASIFRFARFVPRLLGNNNRVYVNDISDSQFLITYPFLDEIKTKDLIPTFDKKVFTSVSKKDAYRFPSVALTLLDVLESKEFRNIRPESVIDSTTEGSGLNKEARDRIDTAFNAFGCQNADFRTVLSILEEHAEMFIKEEDFRTALYEFLQDTPIEYQDEIGSLAIIPVFGTSGGTEYIAWEEDSIFVKKGTTMSPKNYYVLNEHILSKAMCEKMLGVNINEMNAEWERSRYNSQLESLIRGKDVNCVYRYLISEFISGALERNQSIGTLLNNKDIIPLKNQLGQIVDTELFLSNQPVGYFGVEIIQRITVHQECSEFAEYLKYGNLKNIRYENIDYYEALTADDLECLLDDYFAFSEELIRGFYRDGYLPDELISEYNLDYLVMGQGDTGAEYEFPEAPVGDRKLLKKHIEKLWTNPIKVVPVLVTKTVQKGQNNNGDFFDLGINDAREGALRTYTPEGIHGTCFCQMCKRPKTYPLIEVNNIETHPRFYFPQLRVSLCLECSKLFESLRSDANIRNVYMNAIKNVVIIDEGVIEIPVGREKLTFTAKHLAEIQEILKQMPNPTIEVFD